MPDKRTILVVDDEYSIRESFSLILKGKYNLLTVASGEAALKNIADNNVNLVFLDIRMPGMDGLETLSKIKEIDPTLEVVMITAVNDVQKASLAIKGGARDYLVKPFDVDHVLNLAKTILTKKALLSEGRAIRNNAEKPQEEIVGRSTKIHQLLKKIEEIAKKDGPILVLGEIGTEKELVAKKIHDKSSRAAKPFIAITLSRSMPASKIRDLILGKVSGQSTVELKKQPGLLQKVLSGTLFVDNVEFLPPEVLLDPEFQNVRLIGASQKDLRGEIPQIIEIPALRDRPGDVQVLAAELIEKYNHQYHKNIKGLTSEALDVLANYPWPGNISELEAILERLVIIASGKEIDAADLPIDLLLKSGHDHGSDFAARFEKEFLYKVLAKVNGNKKKAAELLGVKEAFLANKL